MEKTQGIVIRTADYRERDRLLVLFTPKGIATVTARGVRTNESKLRIGATTMSFGEYIYGGRNKIDVLTGVEIIDNFFSVWGDYSKTSAILFCFELTEKCFLNEDETAEEFLFLLKIIKEISYGQTVPMCLALKYMIFCAERTGIDYSIIEAYDKKSYEVIKALSAADIDEACTLPFVEEQITKAMIILHNLFADFIGQKLNTFKAVIK